MKLTKKKFKIEGMHCSACAMNIDFDLEDVKGITSAKTNYAKQETELEFDDDTVTEEIIVQTIQKTGYKANLLDQN